MELLYTFDQAKLWRGVGEFFVEVVGENQVLHFEVIDDDAYRSNLYVNLELDRMTFAIHHAEKTYMQTLKDVRVYTKTESELEEFFIFSDGEQVASAFIDYSDFYYPQAGFELIDVVEEERKRNAIPNEITFSLEQLKKSSRHTQMFLVTGEPRLGKTTTILRYWKSTNYIDTDDFDHPAQALHYLCKKELGTKLAVIIGKFRHVQVNIEGVNYSFEDAVAFVLEQRNTFVELFELHFRKRVGPQYAEYAVIVDNQTNQRLKKFVNYIKDEPRLRFITENTTTIPESHYIYAILKQKKRSE